MSKNCSGNAKWYFAGFVILTYVGILIAAMATNQHPDIIKGILEGGGIVALFLFWLVIIKYPHVVCNNKKRGM